MKRPGLASLPFLEWAYAFKRMGNIWLYYNTIKEDIYFSTVWSTKNVWKMFDILTIFPQHLYKMYITQGRRINLLLFLGLLLPLMNHVLTE